MTTGDDHDRIAYPKLPDPITAHDLKQLFTPWRDQIEWAFNATYSKETRLGLLVLLKVFETLGRFIPPKEIPPEVVRHIAQSADVAERDSIVYAKRTLARHHQLVREYIGVREWGTGTRELAERTMEQIAASRTQRANLINGAIEALVREYIELPALSTLRRMAGTVQQRIHDQLFEQVAKSLTTAHSAALDALLAAPRDGQESAFTKLCRPAGRATTRNLKAVWCKNWNGDFYAASR